MRKILFCALLSPLFCFANHPMLEEAKQAYLEGKYQEAYERYSRYDFYCFSPPLEDHFNCFIGRAACERKLGYDKAFLFNWDLIGQLLVGEFDEETSQKMGKGIQESLYMHVHDELVNQRK